MLRLVSDFPLMQVLIEQAGGMVTIQPSLCSSFQGLLGRPWTLFEVGAFGKFYGSQIRAMVKE